MNTQLTVEELEALKESLRYSILNIENSTNHSSETYPQKKKKLNELGDLKTKLGKMVGELKS